MLLSRRTILKTLSGLPLAVSSGAVAASTSNRTVLRFAVASDGHFGQPDTPFEQYHSDAIRWLNQERLQKGLDFVIFNGDLIHDDPTLLYDLKRTYQRLTMPYFVTRGNHDRVGLDVWQEF